MRPIAYFLLSAATILIAAGGQGLLESAPAKDVARANPFEQMNPAGRASAVRAGQKLFHRQCSACHGETAQGTGTAPALASARLQQTTAGAIFWVLRNGSLRHGMPSFAHLPEQQRWQIVTYLKSL